MLALIETTKKNNPALAILSDGSRYSYQDLISASHKFALCLLDGKSDLKEERVAFMVNPGFDYVKVQWAIWQAGGIAVPLCLTHPFPSLQYVLHDTGASIVVVSPEYKLLLEEYCTTQNIRLIETINDLSVADTALPDIDVSRRAMILYTSGTTNKPKGVVSTHANLNAQISTLIDAWEWTSNDHTLCVLPLHHVHGIVNVVSCSMWSGATCQFLPAFSSEAIFNIFLKGELNVFMAVPTIYFKLTA